MLVGCAPEPAPPSGHAPPSPDRHNSLGSDCLLSAADVERISGWKVSNVSPDISFLTRGSAATLELAWNGCRFDAVGGGEIRVSTVVDEAGTPDLSGYEAMLAQAKGTAVDAPPAVGEEAFYGRNDQLWVRTPASTMSFDFLQTTDETKAQLERIAAAVVEAGDVLECEQVPRLLPAKVRAAGSASARILQAGANTVTMCSLPLVIDGQRDRLTVTYTVGAEVFESTKEVSRREPVRVTGVGDSAVAYGERLLFRSGDRAYVVSGKDAGGHPISAKVQAEVARAVMS